MAVALVCRCALRALGLQTLLADLGVSPAWVAATAAEASHWLARHPPTHLLVDWVLPDISGPRWLAALRLVHSDLTAVLLVEDLHPAVLA
ncbi:MAG TPA: hypothetical protein VNK89_00535 [Thermoflexus sp.]|nr:hypothetical protein [Thermoflexus sp.]